jgi:dihydropteroate synthase
MDPFAIRYLHLTSRAEALDLLKRIEVDPYGIEAMLPKMFQLNLLLEGVPCKVANIIKQEMLSLGGDAAVTRGAVACSVDLTDVVLMGSVKQLRRFADKMASQPFGLASLAQQILSLLHHLELDVPPLRTTRREIPVGNRTLIMGILNVTPDSFSDGGCWDTPERAVEEGIRMAGEGADILDIGGESTRPGSEPVSAEEEKRRVLPVIRGLAAKVDIPISVDTMKAEVAREALNEGAEIVNDVSAFGHDARMADVIAAAGAAVILMHMRGKPKSMQSGDLTYRSLRGEVIAFLKGKIQAAAARGIDPEQIMIDPGLGFGKTATDNLKLIKYLKEFKVLGRPILIGVSRKSFIGAVTGGTPAEREEGTAAAVTAGILNGCHVIRVHNVSMMKKVAAMSDALMKA